MRREGRQRTPLVRVRVGVRVRFIALKNISHFKSRHIAFSYPEEKDQKPKKTTSVKKRFSGVDTGACWCCVVERPWNTRQLAKSTSIVVVLDTFEGFGKCLYRVAS